MTDKTLPDSPQVTLCPKCKGPLQEFQTLDADDRIVSVVLKCKRKFTGKKKKGCGYQK